VTGGSVSPCSPIAWQPIATMPDDRKDGRHVLVWEQDGAFVAAYDAEMSTGEHWGWADARENGVRLNPTHWADIASPSSEPA
jgi:hypothetical protein